MPHCYRTASWCISAVTSFHPHALGNDPHVLPAFSEPLAVLTSVVQHHLLMHVSLGRQSTFACWPSLQGPLHRHRQWCSSADPRDFPLPRNKKTPAILEHLNLMSPLRASPISATGFVVFLLSPPSLWCISCRAFGVCTLPLGFPPEVCRVSHNTTKLREALPAPHHRRKPR